LLFAVPSGLAQRSLLTAHRLLPVTVASAFSAEMIFHCLPPLLLRFQNEFNRVPQRPIAGGVT
jgi:hypothetical protein